MALPDSANAATRSRPKTEQRTIDTPAPEAEAEAVVEPSAPSTLATPLEEDLGTNEPIKHKGFILSANAGAMGCTGSICSGANGHNASPGAGFSGFLGGNIGGFVDIGLAGGWGQLRPQVAQGTNALKLFGLQVPDIPPELLNGFDLNSLAVQSAKLDDFRMGPALRLHFVPKGRALAFVGTGFAYHRFRGTYVTPSGTAKLSFHGFDVPMQAGLGMYLNKRLSLGVRFDYLWTYYPAVSIKHPQANMVAPLAILDSQLEERNASLTDNLPRFWSTSLGLRLTL